MASAGNMVSAQDYVGRRPCPTNSSVIGYTNTTELNFDILVDMQWVLDGNEPPELFHYVLCPDTTFKIAAHIGEGEDTAGNSPIIPGLSNSVFSCGDDGNSENNCELTGGDFHFYFPDFVIADEVYLMGLTFSDVDGASVYGDAHPASHIVFIDCHWKLNTGSSTVYVHYTESNTFRRLEGGHPYDLDEMNEVMTKDAKALADLKQSGDTRELQKFVKYSMSCVFVSCSFKNNDDVIATIFNLGGAVELIDTTFDENDVAQLSVFSVLGNGHAFIHEQTNFKNNFARLGPVFIDHTSFLHLSRDNFGVANQGFDCNGIFLEDQLSTCFDQSLPCNGQCCAFGDTTCDLYDTVAPSHAPPTTSPTTSPTKSPTKSPFAVSFRDPTIVLTQTTKALDTPQNTETSGKCTGFCIGFIAMAVAIAVILIVVTVVFSRMSKKTKMIPAASAAAPQLPGPQIELDDKSIS